MTEFDTNVRPPLGASGLVNEFNLDGMEKGNSFFKACDDKFARKLASAVRAYAKDADKEFVTKRLNAGDKYGDKAVENAGLAVWRI